MKRFYKEARIGPASGGGFAILLDERPARTPARAFSVVPSEKLAAAIAGEWNRQGEEIDPRAMVLTGLANAAIDRVASDPEAFARALSAYGECDLLCYRAEGPEPLVRRQSEAWDPLLDWARRRFEVDFETTDSILHRPQPAATLARLGRAVAALDPFRLAALAPLVTISGSLVIALALAEGAITLDAAWAASSLDEAWQAEKWGEDKLAAAALEARRREFEAAYAFLRLLVPRARNAPERRRGRGAGTSARSPGRPRSAKPIRR